MGDAAVVRRERPDADLWRCVLAHLHHRRQYRPGRHRFDEELHPARDDEFSPATIWNPTATSSPISSWRRIRRPKARRFRPTKFLTTAARSSRGVRARGPGARHGAGRDRPQRRIARNAFGHPAASVCCVSWQRLPGLRARPVHHAAGYREPSAAHVARSRLDYVDPAPPSARRSHEAGAQLVHDVFDGFESGSIQQIIYQIGTKMLDGFPAIAEVHLEANNRTWDTVAEQGDSAGRLHGRAAAVRLPRPDACGDSDGAASRLTFWTSRRRLPAAGSRRAATLDGRSLFDRAESPTPTAAPMCRCSAAIALPPGLTNSSSTPAITLRIARRAAVSRRDRDPLRRRRRGRQLSRAAAALAVRLQHLPGIMIDLADRVIAVLPRSGAIAPRSPAAPRARFSRRRCATCIACWPRWMRSAGCECRVDAAGNLRGVRRRHERERALMIGSHLDTVPQRRRVRRHPRRRAGHRAGRSAGRTATARRSKSSAFPKKRACASACRSSAAARWWARSMNLDTREVLRGDPRRSGSTRRAPAGAHGSREPSAIWNSTSNKDPCSKAWICRSASSTRSRDRAA